MINKYTDPIITNYRFDKVGSRASVPIAESLTINNGFLFLKEIPDRNNVVTIGNLVEVQKPEELDSETKFYIDYNAGIVYFDSKLNGTKVNVEYSGIGIVYYPASRIYLEVDENHEIIRTLSDIEGQLSSLTNLKNQQERLKQEIEERNGNLNKTIEEARTINLDGSVEKAKQAKTELDGATNKANLIKGDLDTKINLANTTKTSIDGSIASANEKIDKASEKVNEISSKISEANETHQKLTTTKDDIAASLSDYNKKSAEIKSSSIDLESKNNELKATIVRADESNTTLNATIERSKESNTTLSGTVEESKTKNTELSSSITTATDLKGQLETKNKEASDNITSLDSKVSEGSQLKSDLDTATTNANQINTELKDTTSKANISKAQLDESKVSADELNKNLLSNKDELTTLDNSLKAENEKATKNISDLDTKSASGKQIIDDLNSATLKSETAKTNLDESNTKAIQTNTDLKTTTQTADKTKTSLEQIKNESSTLSNELREGNTTANSNIESLKSENQSAKTNITGLQTENQNALSKQETLSSETTKAEEAIERITELIASSTDLKNKLEQIVASGDLDKYITDPKLREILTAYATKDDLSKIDVTSQLSDYAKTANVNEQIQSLSALLENKVDKVEGYGLSKNDYDDVEKEKLNNSISEIKFRSLAKQEKASLMCVDNIGNTISINLPIAHGYFPGLMSSQDKAKLDRIEREANKVTSLSQLTDDETHRLVTDEEKNKWNNPPNPDLTDYAKKEDLDTKIDKSSITDDYTEKSKDKVLSQIGVYDLYLQLNNDIESATKTKAEKSELPSALSQLTNDTKFKTETEIQEMIANSSKLKKEVVTSLPATGKDDVIYLVKDTKGKDNNNYLEYLWIDGKWELIGSTQVDLSEYATKSEVDSKAEKVDIPTKVSQLENDKNYVEEKLFSLKTLSDSWQVTNGDFNTMYFKQGIKIICAVSKRAGRKTETAKNFPNGLGNYIVYTDIYLGKDGKFQVGATTSQLIYCLENRKFYRRTGSSTSNISDGVMCNWNELEEIESQSSTTPDLSPFTQQELEEAFK